MTSTLLQDALHADPFVPFALIRAGGGSLPVPHPDYVAHPPYTKTVAVATDTGKVRVLSLDDIVSLEYRPAEPNLFHPEPRFPEQAEAIERMDRVRPSLIHLHEYGRGDLD